MFLQTVLTPELLYSCSGKFDPVSLPLLSDEEGRVYTLGEITASSFSELGVAMTDADIAEILNRFGVPAIVTSLSQDVLRWFLGSGEIPVLNAEEITAYSLSVMDDGLYQFCAYFGDPETVTDYLIGYPLSALPVEKYCTVLAPWRPIASETVFVCSFSCSVISFLLIVLLGFGWSAVRFLSLALCMLFLGNIYILRRLPTHFSSQMTTPFLDALLRRMTQELRLYSLVAATFFLTVSIIAILRHLHRRALFRAKTQDSPR